MKLGHFWPIWTSTGVKRCQGGYSWGCNSEYSEKHALYDQLSNADRKLIEGLDPKGCDGKIFHILAGKGTPEGVCELLMTGRAGQETWQGLRACLIFLRKYSALRARKYYHEHHLEINKKRNVHVQCPCGGRFTLTNRAAHQKTSRHMAWMAL